MVFIRFSSFSGVSLEQRQTGRWPLLLNSLFTSLAPYLFIAGHVLMFLPVFIGKLSIIRDIFASSFFRPLARISFSALLLHGLILFKVFFSHEQAIYFDHKNMMFVFFSLVFFTYIAAVFVSLFLEYPFRTMAKVVFSPPKKILRLNKELAKELNTNIDNIFTDDVSDDESENHSQRFPASNLAEFPEAAEEQLPAFKKQRGLLDLSQLSSSASEAAKANKRASKQITHDEDEDADYMKEKHE